jgi:hypothetical protein
MNSPKDLNVVITGDQSTATRTSFNDLCEFYRYWFCACAYHPDVLHGVTNAFFVALSVPLSMFVAFMFLPGARHYGLARM